MAMANVAFEVFPSSKLFSTLWTLVLLREVALHVGVQYGFRSEALIAYITTMWPLPGVLHLVYSECRFGRFRLTADRADEYLWHSVCELVLPENCACSKQSMATIALPPILTGFAFNIYHGFIRIPFRLMRLQNVFQE